MSKNNMHSRALIAVAALLAAPKVMASQHFITAMGRLIDTRLDPIRTEGQPASHVHRFAGSAALMETVTYDQLEAEQCTTAEVKDDKSLYWQPTLYYQHADGTFTPLDPEGVLQVYWKADKSGDEQLYDMPAGFRMITGDPKRTTKPQGKSLAETANAFECFCQDGGDPECNGNPTAAYSFDDVKHLHCDIIRLGSDFPNCWDGVNLDSPDHKSHVVFNEEDAGCPPSHPKRIPTARIESWYGVSKIPWTKEGSLTLSNGDQTGYSSHADFINGFSEGDPNDPTDSILVRALMTCITMQGDAKSCPILAPLVAPAGQCVAARKLDEDIGKAAPLTKLPGNNPVWKAPAEKPSEPGYSEAGKIVDNPGGQVPVPGAADPSALPSSVAADPGAPAATNGVGSLPPAVNPTGAQTSTVIGNTAPVIPTAAVPTGSVEPVVGVPSDGPPAAQTSTVINNPAPQDPAGRPPRPTTDVAAAVGAPSDSAPPPATDVAPPVVTDAAPAPTSQNAPQPERTWTKGNGGGHWGGWDKHGDRGDKTIPVVNAAAIQTDSAPIHTGGCGAKKRHMQRRNRTKAQL